MIAKLHKKAELPKESPAFSSIIFYVNVYAYFIITLRT